MERKIVVPEGMRKSVITAVGETVKGSTYIEIGDAAAIACARWLSENPIVPTREEAEGLLERVFSDPPYIYGPPGDGMPGQTVNLSREQLTGRHFSKEQKVFAEWQRRMFLAPEIAGFVECDACRAKAGSPTLCRGCLHNRVVIEDFQRREKQAKGETR